jgi:hypothetical protein
MLTKPPDLIGGVLALEMRTTPLYKALEPYMSLVHGIMYWDRGHQHWRVVVPHDAGVVNFPMDPYITLAQARQLIAHALEQPNG